MLSVKDLRANYGRIPILVGIDLEIAEGEVVGILGHNGMGKTTLMKNVMGLLKADSGKVFLDGRDVTSLAGNRRARKGIALVPQGRQIFPRLTVEENLRVGMEARAVVRGKVPEFVYEMFPVLKEMTRRKGGDLSGGQQQQLAISRALVGDPRVLLLDEPTEGIQPNIIQQIGHVLKDLATKSNMTIVLVEQYLDFVREFGVKFYLMNRGQVVADGTTEELTDELVSQHLSV